MAFYAVGILPLIKALKDPGNGVQVWYADDSSKEGKLESVHAWFEQLKSLGPGFGYFPEPKKSVLVVAEADLGHAKTLFGDCGPTITSDSPPTRGF